MSEHFDLFGGKAADYERYRVDYPEDVIDAVCRSIEMEPADVIADLGSGTGMLSRWFLKRGNRVFGVEPDDAMRRVAEGLLDERGSRFTSIKGVAEATTLPDASVDVVTAGNAFHYFEPQSARLEALRILRPGGRAAVIGHELVSMPNAFMLAYVAFLAEVTPPGARTFHESARVAHSLQEFFAGAPFQQVNMGDHEYPLTWDELSGRFLTTSVAPQAADPGRPSIIARLSDVFQRFERNGAVPFQLRWGYAWGKLKPAL